MAGGASEMEDLIRAAIVDSSAPGTQPSRHTENG